jgi:hypothetical protein
MPTVTRGASATLGVGANIGSGTGIAGESGAAVAPPLATTLTATSVQWSDTPERAEVATVVAPG